MYSDMRYKESHKNIIIKYKDDFDYIEYQFEKASLLVLTDTLCSSNTQLLLTKFVNSSRNYEYEE